MNIQSISNYINFNPFSFTEEEAAAREKIFNDKPKFLDKYFISSVLPTIVTMWMPFPYRVAANVFSSCLFRGMDCLLNKKKFDFDFAIDLISNVGATVLLGELESKGLSLLGIVKI